ncbi:M14 family metallopeptidase [Gaetbulibacter sp. M240]|uniref:M14 family metallopeptidase n=1 Tax=Gaetbulibacter sp. M240 TaxID=3126511 RepID=UPI00374EB258
MKYTLALLFAVLISCQSNKKSSNEFKTSFEKSGGKETATYDEAIAFYKQLADTYPEIKIQSIGETDSGRPLHLVIYNPDTQFNYDIIRETKRILLINNGIHPGEPDGIDATMLLFRDLAKGTLKAPQQTVLVTIPIYNVGGSLNRNSYSRTNQNGPESYGFRGNARNFDLNRDFIKSDTKNARSFAKIFHLVKPDVFIDNHVSNGADYQYTLTHLFTQHNKLGGDLGHYLHNKMMPQLIDKLETKKWIITPYVNVFNEVPEKGFSQFLDSPRYSTGYTTLFNSLGMMVETHMLKPYKQRVEGTYELMKSMLEITESDGKQITVLRKKSTSNYSVGSSYPVQWEVDTTKASNLQFKGYEGALEKSEVTGFDRLKYDRSKPFTKTVTYQDYFKPSTSITIPKAYVIPQGWFNVIELLKLNKINLHTIKQDTVIQIESYRITDYETGNNPYEGHYLHKNTKVQKSMRIQHFKAGDFIAESQQDGIRYLLETLEPEAVDSFFNWNFFDTILQQKEGFSPYVWEDKAAQILTENDSLREAFETLKSKDSTFAKSWHAQLDWIHKHSKYYEKSHLQYPIYRIL